MSREVVVIQHVPFEDTGTLAPVLVQAGYSIRTIQAVPEAFQDLDPLAPAALIVMGGPIGVYESENYPFLTDELHIIAERLARDLPTLGICLGAQLMADALGARVYPGGRKEIGWSPLQLTPAGMNSVLQPLSRPGVNVLHWHGDTFDLPRDAVLLASTSVYSNQAFAWGDHGLGLQFHPEVTAEGLEPWYIGHACEISATPGVSVTSLREAAAAHAPTLARASQALWKEWIRGVG